MRLKEYAFEIELSTGVWSGVGRMATLIDYKNVRFYVIANDARKYNQVINSFAEHQDRYRFVANDLIGELYSAEINLKKMRMDIGLQVLWINSLRLSDSSASIKRLFFRSIISSAFLGRSISEYIPKNSRHQRPALCQRLVASRASRRRVFARGYLRALSTHASARRAVCVRHG